MNRRLFYLGDIVLHKASGKSFQIVEMGTNKNSPGFYYKLKHGEHIMDYVQEELLTYVKSSTNSTSELSKK